MSSSKTRREKRGRYEMNGVGERKAKYPSMLAFQFYRRSCRRRDGRLGRDGDSPVAKFSDGSRTGGGKPTFSLQFTTSKWLAVAW